MHAFLGGNWSLLFSNRCGLNDVSGFTDPEMVAVAAESDCGCIVMHWNKDGLGARVERKQVQLDDMRPSSQ